MRHAAGSRMVNIFIASCLIHIYIKASDVNLTKKKKREEDD